MKAAKHFILFILLHLIGHHGVQCQNFEEVDYGIVKNLDWKNFNYTDLFPIEKILQGSNILMLSESDHGDGSTYDAQCMILKGLIDSGKISTIYIESSWILIDKINDILNKEGLEGISKCRQHMRSYELIYWLENGFWNYLAQKVISGKVRLRGIDVGASSIVLLELLDEAKSFDSVRKFSLDHKDEYNNVLFVYENFDGFGIQSTVGLETYDIQLRFISSIMKEYQVKNNYYRIKQWQAILNYFYWMYKRTELLKNNKYANVPENEKQYTSFMSIRDSLMADHFFSIYSTNEKCIVSVANYHAVRNSIFIDEWIQCCKSSSAYLFGDILDKKLSSEIYRLCFIGLSGGHAINYYNRKPQFHRYVKPRKNSLDSYVYNKIAKDYCIIDLNDPALKNSTYSLRALSNQFFNARWSNHFSGVFFIKEMKPLEFTKASSF